MINIREFQSTKSGKYIFTYNTHANSFYLIDQAAGGHNGVLNGLRSDIFTVGQHDDILEPTRNDQVA